MNCPRCDILMEWVESEHLYFCPKCKIFVYPHEHDNEVNIIEIRLTGNEKYKCPQRLGMELDR